MSASTAVALRNPSLSALRREHQAALERPMTGAVMLGDPRFDDTGENAELRRICQYATDHVRRTGLLTGDLSNLDAVYLAPDVVVFVRADVSQAEVARVTVPVFRRGAQLTRPKLLPNARQQDVDAFRQAERVVVALSSHAPSNGAALPVRTEIGLALSRAGMQFEADVVIANNGLGATKVDFLVGAVAVGFHVAGAGGGLTARRAEKLCMCGEVRAAVIATCSPHAYAAQISGKPAFTFGLGRQWLRYVE